MTAKPWRLIFSFAFNKSTGALPPKLSLQCIHRQMDHGRPAVRTGARRGACFQIVQQGTLFIGGEHLPSLYGQPLADTPGNFCLEFIL
jgi:hypothetical protein